MGEHSLARRPATALPQRAAPSGARPSAATPGGPGNQFLASIQPKLEVSAPGDAREREADLAAERVLGDDDAAAMESGTRTTPLIQRSASADDARRNVPAPPSSTHPPTAPVATAPKPVPVPAPKPTAPVPATAVKGTTPKGNPAKDAPAQKRDDVVQRLQRAATTTRPFTAAGASAQESGTAPAAVEERLAAPSAGRPLDPAAQSFFGHRFGADFSGVRIHDDAEAARLSAAVHALAFTHGHDIYFAAGRFAPHDTAGRRLLAHELAHTIQQGAAPAMPAADILATTDPAAPETQAAAADTERPGAISPAGTKVTGPSAGINGDAAPRTVGSRPAPAPRPAAAGTPAVQREADGEVEDDTQPEPAPDPQDKFLDAATAARLKEAIDQHAGNYPQSVGNLWLPERLLFDTIEVPAYKLDGQLTPASGRPPYDVKYGVEGRLVRAKDYRRGHPDQRKIWRDNIDTSNIAAAVDAKAQAAAGGVEAAASSRYQATVKMRGSSRSGTTYIGTRAAIIRKLTIPQWGAGTRPTRRAMQVEHMVELQLGYWHAGHVTENPNVIGNMILLDGGINRAAGRYIQAAIKERLRSLLQQPDIAAALAAPEAGGAGSPGTATAPGAPATTPGAASPAPQGSPAAAGPSAAPLPATQVDKAIGTIKSLYSVEFMTPVVGPARGIPTVAENQFWRSDTVAAATHLDAVDIARVDNSNRTTLMLFNHRSGGFYREFSLAESFGPGERTFLGRKFPIVAKSFPGIESVQVGHAGQIGTLVVEFDVPALKTEGQATTRREEVPVYRIPGAKYAGYLEKRDIKRLLAARATSIPGSSPVTFDEVDIFEDGMFIGGHVDSDNPLLRGSRIDFRIEGGDLSASKTFTADEVKVPRPLLISSLSLTLGASTRHGFTADGRIDFGIERVGTGYIEAGARTGTGRNAPGLFLAGGFDFDPGLFDPARISFLYADGELTADGWLGIPAGKIRGVRRARLHMNYAHGVFTALGDVEPDIPGVEQGTLLVVVSDADGLVVAGGLRLSPNPAIRSGMLEARIQRRPDGTYKVSGHGTAEPAIPHVDAALEATYDDGAFDLTASAAFSRGMLSGRLLVAATNRPVNPETGLPEGEPGRQITVYGSGAMVVRFSPWLQGTVGVRILPNGEIQLAGQVAVPGGLQVFPRLQFDKELLDLHLDIPLFGVSVLGQRIGVFATVGAGFTVDAGIGPGTLENLAVGIEYNPDHEEATHVVGTGSFVIPASAGAHLRISGGIGAGIPVVSAEAGIDLTGSLNLAGEARADAQVDWSPATGVVLNALGSIFVSPRFAFDVGAHVNVTADLLFKTLHLYHQEWNLAHYEYGSNLLFGVEFPVHYADNEPFSISADDVRFTVPDVDPLAVVDRILGI